MQKINGQHNRRWYAIYTRPRWEKKVNLLLGEKGVESVKWYTIVAYMLVFSPSLLLTFGWVRWWRVRPPRYWRYYAIAWGLATASISALCLYGVLSYVQLAHIGYAVEHRLARHFGAI